MYVGLILHSPSSTPVCFSPSFFSKPLPIPPFSDGNVSPGCDAPRPHPAELTGITKSVLRANKARPFHEVWTGFASWIEALVRVGGNFEGRGVVLAAHNARFDREFLVREMTRAGFERWESVSDKSAAVSSHISLFRSLMATFFLTN